MNAIRERIRSAKTRLPGGASKKAPGKISPSKPRKAGGTKPLVDSSPAKKGRKAKKELAEDDGAAVKEED